MKSEPIEKLVKQISPLFAIEDTSESSPTTFLTEGGRSFASGKGQLWLLGNDNREFHRTTEEFWKRSKELRISYTLKEFQRIIGNTLAAEVTTGQIDYRKAACLISNKLETAPLQSWTIMRQVEGAEFAGGEKKLGTITIASVDGEDCSGRISKGKSIAEEAMKIYKTWRYAAIIEVQSRQAARASEIAEERFEEIESIISALAGRLSIYSIRISNKSFSYLHDYIAIAGDQVTYGREVKDASAPINLDEQTHFIEGKAAKFLYRVMESKKPSEFEQAIHLSAVWLGRANREASPAFALVQYVFALECLLKHSKADEFLTESITAQMADSAAYLLADDFNKRIEIAKIVRRIYKSRSAVVHGGTSTTLERDMYAAYDVIHKLIGRAIYLCVKRNIKSKSDFARFVAELKYGWKPDDEMQQEQPKQ